MATTILWLGYAVAPAFEIVPADSVGEGSTYLTAPGWCMFCISLVSVLIPTGMFGRRNLVRTAAFLVIVSAATAPWLYAGREAASLRVWLFPVTLATIVLGTIWSYTWRLDAKRG